MTPHKPAQLAKRFRRALERRGAGHLMHRLGVIVGEDGSLTFKIGSVVAGAWLDGDLVAMAKLEGKVDALADRWGVDVQAVAQDGTVLYRRMTT